VALPPNKPSGVEERPNGGVCGVKGGEGEPKDCVRPPKGEGSGGAKPTVPKRFWFCRGGGMGEKAGTVSFGDADGDEEEEAEETGGVGDTMNGCWIPVCHNCEIHFARAARDSSSVSLKRLMIPRVKIALWLATLSAFGGSSAASTMSCTRGSRGAGVVEYMLMHSWRRGALFSSSAKPVKISA